MVENLLLKSLMLRFQSLSFYFILFLDVPSLLSYSDRIISEFRHDEPRTGIQRDDEPRQHCLLGIKGLDRRRVTLDQCHSCLT